MILIVEILVSIGWYTGLFPGQHQAIIRTNAGILFIGPLQTNFSEILIKIQNFSFTENALENVVRKMAAILSRPPCVKEDLPSDDISMAFIGSSVSWYIQHPMMH